MNYLTVDKVSKSVGEKELFHQITFGLEKGQKSALIARNGTGKVRSSISLPDSTPPMRDR